MRVRFVCIVCLACDMSAFACFVSVPRPVCVNLSTDILSTMLNTSSLIMTLGGVDEVAGAKDGVLFQSISLCMMFAIT